MKLSEIKNKTPEELKAIVSESRGKLFGLGFQSPDQKVKDTSQKSKIKKDIARALTLLKEKTNKI